MPFNPSFPGIYVQEISDKMKTIEAVAKSVTGFIGMAMKGPLDQAVEIGSYEDYSDIFGGLMTGSTMSYAVRQYFEHGGKEALVVRIHNDAGLEASDYLGNASLNTGLHAFDEADILNILVVPPPSRSDDTPPEVWHEALRLCKRKRSMLIVDPPFSVTDPSALLTSDIITSIVPRDSQAVLYYPHLLMKDPGQGGTVQAFVASGAIAGIWAKTDEDRGVWKAPAGLEAALQGVDDLSYTLTNSENASLNRIGVNCMRDFSYRGKLVWGARTLEGADYLASEWKYVPVRRLALHIEESLDRGLAWAVFEPNAEPLWSQLRLHIGNFMQDLFTKGAFAGTTAKEAYFVKTGAETTTQADINRGIVNVMLGFAPLKPAEFVIIKMQLRTSI